MKCMQERQRWSATLQGKYFNVLGHFFSLYCMWKIFICTINIIFDRVGKKDVVTRGIEIAVEWLGIQFDIAFWSQHISFLLVGCIVITSIRGLLITLTKVRKNFKVFQWFSLNFLTVFLQNIVEQIVKHHRVDTRATDGNVFLLFSFIDSHEHARRVSGDHNWSLEWSAVQFLPPMVRRHLSFICAFVDFLTLYYQKTDGGKWKIIWAK